ncbi:hypothetical protein ACFHYJ_00850 [Pasteurella multocida]
MNFYFFYFLWLTQKNSSISSISSTRPLLTRVCPMPEFFSIQQSDLKSSMISSTIRVNPAFVTEYLTILYGYMLDSAGLRAGFKKNPAELTTPFEVFLFHFSLLFDLFLVFQCIGIENFGSG